MSDISPHHPTNYVPNFGQTQDPPKKGKESWQSVVSTIAILLTAPLFALFLIAFVFQYYVVDGPSMETTLQEKDRLVVWKVPRTWAKITRNAYIPERGDIIVFAQPELRDSGQKSDRQLIKRVVALPGERITISGGVVTVYNDSNQNGFHPEALLSDGSKIESTPGELDTTVPENAVFVLGDNRTNSLDSRAFGPVAADDIVGKLTARFLPIGEARRF